MGRGGEHTWITINWVAWHRDQSLNRLRVKKDDVGSWWKCGSSPILWLWWETDYISSYDIWWCLQLHVDIPGYPNLAGVNCAKYWNMSYRSKTRRISNQHDIMDMNWEILLLKTCCLIGSWVISRYKGVRHPFSCHELIELIWRKLRTIIGDQMFKNTVRWKALLKWGPYTLYLETTLLTFVECTIMFPSQCLIRAGVIWHIVVSHSWSEVPESCGWGTPNNGHVWSLPSFSTKLRMEHNGEECTSITLWKKEWFFLGSISPYYTISV